MMPRNALPVSAAVILFVVLSPSASAALFDFGFSVEIGRRYQPPVVYYAEPVYYAAPIRPYYRAPRQYRVTRYYYSAPVRHYRYVEPYYYGGYRRSYYGGHSYRRHGLGRSVYRYRYYGH